MLLHLRTCMPAMLTRGGQPWCSGGSESATTLLLRQAYIMLCIRRDRIQGSATAVGVVCAESCVQMMTRQAGLQDKVSSCWVNDSWVE